MKLLHAADLHLDSPLVGLERYEGAPVEQMRDATRAALVNLVELCLDEDVQLLLLAGDLYDGDWRDYSTGLFFAAQMARLQPAGVEVVWIRGNHDAASRITRRLQLPANVTELSTARPESRIFEDLEVAVHGQGFASAAVTDDLAAAYPEALPGLLNVGLLHTSLTGRPGHESYAPTRLETLLSKGYDYWALGHVHRREVLCEEPWVLFAGNLQGRHVREAGAKGATLIRVADGRIAEVAHRSLDVVRWQVVEVEAGEAATGDEVVDLCRGALEEALAAAEGRSLAARVVLRGASRAHDALVADEERWTNSVRAAALELGGEGVWVEKVRFATRAELDLEELGQRDDAVGQLVRSLAALRHDEGRLAALVEELSELARKLPPEARGGEDGLRLDEPAALAEMLGEVEQLLLPRLLARGGRGAA